MEQISTLKINSDHPWLNENGIPIFTDRNVIGIDNTKWNKEFFNPQPFKRHITFEAVNFQSPILGLVISGAIGSTVELKIFINIDTGAFLLEILKDTLIPHMECAEILLSSSVGNLQQAAIILKKYIVFEDPQFSDFLTDLGSLNNHKTHLVYDSHSSHISQDNASIYFVSSHYENFSLLIFRVYKEVVNLELIAHRDTKVLEHNPKFEKYAFIEHDSLNIVIKPNDESQSRTLAAFLKDKVLLFSTYTAYQNLSPFQKILQFNID
jgi:hypothetical protein